MSYFLPVILFIGLLIIISSFFMVKQQTAAIIERFGKFTSIRNSGLQFKIPLIDKIAGRVNLRIQQLDVIVETKTKDDVFVRLKISVQFQVVKSNVYDAFYKLEDPQNQITSYVFDVVRSEVPKMKLDDVFVRKDDIAIAVKSELNQAMTDYGYDIIKTLVTDIDPDQQVKIAMNRINASEREKVAAEYEAEAERIKIVAKARAEAESKRLQGQGIADQRREIARGLEESVEVLNNVGINSQEASALIVVTQHYDTLQSIGEETNSNLILLPNSPQAGSDMLNNMIASFVASNQIGEEMKKRNAELGIAAKTKKTKKPRPQSGYTDSDSTEDLS
ncbi:MULTISPECIES: SPFH domain-containing protein [unclassified Leeuwenhoekiella]|uniref:SPFH domain-containing protein n=1 Tax=unclassified Leeuwenhoekiella TaxID=2615029 RepID=UPI000C61D34F|nr:MULTISPECIES: SPFH domain-containing protein [unclassified Leeuwenhoekiella]MAW95991.1 SPFH domain-containing protein [Leeuwenhoekiella sp.]MBA79985.1 SPFH domain-containing protein [Leeuwenhoekiella sp.]|tara:strand:+ start:17077 stop:18078 length:1002 start_codon:yes stop_codon:yes gene_type:complete